MAYTMNIDEILSIINNEKKITLENKKIIDFTIGNNSFSVEDEIISNEIMISKNTYSINDNNFILNGKENQETLELHFNLSNKCIGYKNHFLESKSVAPMTGNMIYLGLTNEKTSLHFEKDTNYQTFDIHFTKNSLEKYYGEDKRLDQFIKQMCEDKSFGLTNNEISVTPQILCAIQDINQCKYQGLTRKIYIESKIFEIIAHLLEYSKEKKSTITRKDKESVHLAASLIKENIKNPLTIDEISKKIGINQTKLKKIFKETFDCTIFNYLQNIRMNNAKKHITDSDLSIDEISQLSGYTSTSNFSAAFRKHYGFPPSQLK